MSAAVMKRNGGTGNASSVASNGHSKSFAVASTAATALRKDPAALLARGYTARYLGAVLQAYNNKNSNNNPSIPSITPLSNEEIDRDLRHICAYQEAATRYHQLTYAATNHINLNAAAKNSNNHDAQHTDGTGNHLDPSTSSQFFATAALPVRIDPEEEKRRLTAQKRIQRAEAVREELEQQYVALRAHYVVTTQELQSFAQESERTIETLQQSVTSTASVLGYQRAKLQMTRDAAAAFQYRTNMILSREYGSAATDAAPSSTTTTTNPDDAATAMLSQGSESNAEMTSASTSDHQFSLLAAWVALEEECKRHLSVSSKGGGTKSSKGKQAAASAAVTIIPWSCTKEPATSNGIPMLLSTLSTVPEKSIAVHTGNMFGSTNRRSLTWMESHLPSTIDDDGDDVALTELDAIESLRTEVAALERELLQERQLNQEILVKTGQSRIQHDEWVAMISLVRQETEAVLYRHNVLLESDEVQHAINSMATNNASSVEAISSTTTMTMSHAQDDDEDEVEEDAEHEVDETNDDKDIDATAGPDGVSADMNDRTDSKVSGTNKVNSAAALDEEGASEADDEGMEEEGEEVDDWDTTNNTGATGSNKRNAAAAATSGLTGAGNNTNEDSEGSPGGSRKRRKV